MDVRGSRPEDALRSLRSEAALAGSDRLSAASALLAASPVARWWLAGAMAAVLVVTVALVALWPRVDPAAAPPASSLPLAFASTTSIDIADDVVVHAAGAVAHPGIYRLAPTARVADLVEAAGGLTSDADLDRLNLASPLTDGGRLYVPRLGEVDLPEVAHHDPAPGPGGDGEGAGALVDVNRATASALEALPGIGPATAEAILSHRERHGPFRSVDSLIDVRGIGPAKLEQLRDLVRV
jgi:competence protein ComEA